MTRRPWPFLSAAAAIVVLVAGCGSGGTTSSATYTFDPDDTRVHVDTADLRAAKAAAGIDPCPATRPGATGRKQGLPAITLPCLGGGADVNLAGLSGTPTVINFWAQYCGPCRSETPMFERVHEAAGGAVEIIGVDWQDPLPGRAIAFADELGLTYPQLADPDGATRAPMHVSALPITVFVDAKGRITHVEYGAVDSAQELVRLISDHVDVEVRL